MSQGDLFAVMGIGGLFFLLGLAAIISDRRERKNYYDSISGHADAREFLENWPQRPQFGALKTGGWIAIIIGVIIIIMGGAFWLWS